MTNSLLLMIKKMKEAGDKKVCDAVFTELSKVFNCLFETFCPYCKMTCFLF